MLNKLNFFVFQKQHKFKTLYILVLVVNFFTYIHLFSVLFLQFNSLCRVKDFYIHSNIGNDYLFIQTTIRKVIKNCFLS